MQHWLASGLACTARERARHDADVDILARTLWGEARGIGVRGMEAVGAVIVNRAACPARFGRTMAQVCLAPAQFRCWDASYGTLAKLRAAADGDPALLAARRVARRALGGALADPTGGATRYHAKGEFPRWARDRRVSAFIRRRHFYAGVDDSIRAMAKPDASA